MLRLIVGSIVWKIICIIKRWLDGVARWPFVLAWGTLFLFVTPISIWVWPSIVLFFPLFILLWLKPQNESEAARIPQWQQAMSEELPVLQKTSFITLSDREGKKPLPDGNTTIEGNSDSLLVSILIKLLPHWKRLLLYGLWLQLPRWESSLRSSEMWGMLFWKENYMRRFTCHLRQGDPFLNI